MKRFAFALIVMLGVAGFAAAQVTSPTARRSRSAQRVWPWMHRMPRAAQRRRRERRSPTANSGNLALWGEDLSPLYGQTLVFGNSWTRYLLRYDPELRPTGGYAAVGLPSSAGDGIFVITACLSCHDGNLAKVGMMKGTYCRNRDHRGVQFQSPYAARK